MRRHLKFIHSSYALIFALFLCSCANIPYYTQSISGQLELFNAQQDIGQLLQSPDIAVELKEKLELVKKIRRFASQELALPDNASYQSYADLGRDYVVWNVVATPKLSLQPLQWCFFIVGCLNYRGYFSEVAAQQFANSLRAQGHDVFVGGVSAYSTLGWFNDPVLNTMLNRDMTYLTKVMFHELAHQKIYIKNDTEFNEAFADTVALAGVKRWLSQFDPETKLKTFEMEQAREDEFVQLVMQTRNELEHIYNSDIPDQGKQQQKSEILNNMRAKYAQLRTHWNNDPSYDAWFNNGLNNAKLAAVTTYRNLVPHFARLLGIAGDDIEKFYVLAETLGQCSYEDRRTILKSGKAVFDC